MRAGAVAMVFGTRPELVKLAPLAWLLGPAASTIHTGQHPWPTLATLAADLDLRAPDRCGSVPSAPRGRQLGEAVAAVTDALLALDPEVVIVQGDTNSTLAGALAATGLDLPLVHVEAGLRAFDRALPEERNRIVVDHLADLLAAPTETARTNLRNEGIPDARVVVTGNTVVDAVQHCRPNAHDRACTLAEFGVEADRFVLATFHRPENVDEPSTLTAIFAALRSLPLPVVLPVHPRTEERARRLGVALAGGSVRAVPPLGYRRFLGLASDAAVIVTDSGGIQEEASILGRPAVVVRRSTERPEVLGSVTTLVSAGPEIGVEVRRVLDDLPAVRRRLAELTTPFGTGDAASRTVEALAGLLGSR